MEKRKEIVISAGNAAWLPDAAEAWSRRGLLGAFVRRGLAVRYRQAVIGMIWSFLQPAMTVAIFTLIFNKVADLHSDGLPYSVFAAIGMTSWLWFARSLQESANSLVSNQQMLVKVWFPRVLLPAASVVEAFVEYMIMLMLVAALCAYHGILPHTGVLLWPLFALLVGVTALGLGLLFSALNVSFRDVRVMVPFMLQAGLFATPVIWSPESIPEEFRYLVAINPLSVAIDGMRWAVGGSGALMTPVCVGVAVSVATAMLFGGAIYFARSERRFADVI